MEAREAQGAALWPRAMGLACLSPFKEGLCDLFDSCHAPEGGA